MYIVRGLFVFMALAHTAYGAPIAPADASTPSVSAPSSTHLSDSTVPVGFLSHGLAATLGMSVFSPRSNSYHSGQGTYDVEFPTNVMPSVGLKYNRIRADGFGYSLGARYDFFSAPSEMKTITSNSNMRASTFDMQWIALEPNLTYQIEGAYLFVGPNYLIPTLGDHLQGSSIGGQFGAGWIVGPQMRSVLFGIRNLSVELMFQTLRLQFSNFQSHDLSGTSNDAMLSGGMLRIGYSLM